MIGTDKVQPIGRTIPNIRRVGVKIGKPLDFSRYEGMEGNRYIERAVTDEIGSSALFAARFRECAARALLLPRRRPDRRQPLWQQRQRSAQLLEVARKYPQFPVILETVREVLQDVYDLPALKDVAGGVEIDAGVARKSLRDGDPLRRGEGVGLATPPSQAVCTGRLGGERQHRGAGAADQRRAAGEGVGHERFSSRFGAVSLIR